MTVEIISEILTIEEFKTRRRSAKWFDFILFEDNHFILFFFMNNRDNLSKEFFKDFAQKQFRIMKPRFITRRAIYKKMAKSR